MRGVQHPSRAMNLCAQAVVKQSCKLPSGVLSYGHFLNLAIDFDADMKEEDVKAVGKRRKARGS